MLLLLLLQLLYFTSHYFSFWQDIQTWIILLSLAHNPLGGSYLKPAALWATLTHAITPVHQVHQQEF